jgi:hypothetical protein
VENATVDVRSSPFHCCAILRARAAGGGERDRPTGTFEHTNRASDLPRRESECCCRNRTGLASVESASDVERIRHRHTDAITTCFSDVRKKATLGANQKRRILQACVSSTNLSVTDFIAHYQYRVISNRLKQPVTDRASIGNGLYKPVTDKFNICNGLF